MAIKTDPASVWKEFDDDKAYKVSKGFYKTWKECVDFKEGRHWKAPTAKTKCMPRIVINQCGFTIRNKKSNILSQTLKLVYSPAEVPDGGDSSELIIASEDYTDAAASVWEDLDQDSLNECAVDSTLTKGTGIFHYYWDNSYKGGQFTNYIGRIKGQTIKPTDICFGNPTLKPYQTQDQPFIIIRNSDRDVDELKERSKKNGENWQMIVPDEQKTGTDIDNETAKNANTTTSYTKYYRKDGQIYWTEITATSVVQKPRTLSPTQETAETVKPFTIYPVEVLVFDEIDDCVYGRSAIQDIITINKAINWIYGMIMLGVQGNAWPKILAKMGALLQAVTNEPGEIITDHYQPGGVDGIKYMQPPNFSNAPPALAEKLYDLSRQTTGTTEVNTGEVIGANMAASAIIALQNQAQKPNQADQNRLFRSDKNIGRILEEFFKIYYNTPRPIASKDAEDKDITKKFLGTAHKDKSFNLKIDVSPTTTMTEPLTMAILKEMADRTWIDKYQFTKYSPSNAMPSGMKHDFEVEQEKMMKQQAAQAAAIDSAKASLTPVEQAELGANPQLMEQAMASTGMGGGQNPMSL
ncbi:MAG TPA: hypothetical protein VIK78_19795 [Ruminiclostridium sp.]